MDVGLPPAKRWLVWWYGAVLKGVRDQTQPKIAVLFRETDTRGNLADTYIYRPVNVTNLGLMSLGSVWQAGSLIARADYSSRTFHVSFDDQGWSHYTLGQGRDTAEPYLIPSAVYPVFKQRPDLMADAWMLRFATQEGYQLLIPCQSFFNRCYASSAEARRVLLTYPWPEIEKRFYASPLQESRWEVPGKWTVERGRSLYDADAPFLAYLKYKAEARRRATSLYTQIENAKPGKPPFLKVKPWWRGPVEIRASGIAVAGTKSFLALGIDAITGPPCKEILLARPSEPQVDRDEGDDPPGAAEAAIVRRSAWPDPIPMSEDLPPDHDTGVAWMDEPALRWLGKTPVVIAVRGSGSADPRSGVRFVDSSPDGASAGERQGGGKNVGKASWHIPVELESHGVLRDMWEALSRIAASHPDTLGEVACFTFEAGLRVGPEPKLISFPFRTNEQGDPIMKGWATLPEDDTRRPRGMLVARVQTPRGGAYLAEIERRAKYSSNFGKGGGVKADRKRKEEVAEESLKGLIFVLDEESDLPDWIATAISELKASEGVYSEELLAACPGVARTFKHVPSRKNEYPCEKTVMLALSKVGVKVKEKANRLKTAKKKTATNG